MSPWPSSRPRLHSMLWTRPEITELKKVLFAALTTMAVTAICGRLGCCSLSIGVSLRRCTHIFITCISDRLILKSPVQSKCYSTSRLVPSPKPPGKAFLSQVYPFLFAYPSKAGRPLCNSLDCVPTKANILSFIQYNLCTNTFLHEGSEEQGTAFGARCSSSLQQQASHAFLRILSQERKFVPRA